MESEKGVKITRTVETAVRCPSLMSSTSLHWGIKHSLLTVISSIYNSMKSILAKQISIAIGKTDEGFHFYLFTHQTYLRGWISSLHQEIPLINRKKVEFCTHHQIHLHGAFYSWQLFMWHRCVHCLDYACVMQILHSHPQINEKSEAKFTTKCESPCLFCLKGEEK